MGIILSSSSTWASPFHGVPKGDGGWLPCGDYRRLNEIITPARYPIPHIQDFASSWPVKPSFPRSTGCAPTTCSLLPRTTSQKRQLTPHLVCMSSVACLLVSEMLLKPFSGLLMVYVMIWTLSWSFSIISWLLALL